jgi:hypothetical protein
MQAREKVALQRLSGLERAENQATRWRPAVAVVCTG